MTTAEIVVVADAAAGTLVAAERIAASLASAVAARGRADWATTGGSSPFGIYRRLVDPPLTETVPWPGVHVWWGDDRYVSRDHPLSNVKAFDDILLDLSGAEEGTAGTGRPGVPIALANVHPFPTGEAIGRARGAAWCAATLASELRDAGLPASDGWPVLDLVLLGVGGDGHILSVFPGSSAFDATELAMAIPAPTHIEPHVERVTLHPGIVGVARGVLVVASGADKAGVIGRAFRDETDPRAVPSRLAVRPGATWILDEAAAAEIPGR